MYLPELYLVQLGLVMVQSEILQIQDLVIRKRSSENIRADGVKVPQHDQSPNLKMTLGKIKMTGMSNA